MSRRGPRDLVRVLCGRADEVDARRLVSALRDDAGLRRDYDRAAAAMRALERRGVAEVELDWVERWLEADGVFGRATAPPRAATRWWWIGAAVAAAAALVLALRPRPPQGPDGHDALQPRGGADARWLGLSVLCDDGHGADAPLREVAGGRCPLDATLGFAVRVDARHTGGEHLVLFGIDARGQLQYYVPTPEQAAPRLGVRDVWQPLDRAVRLSVHHAPGAVHVYAALVPEPPGIAAIEAAARLLTAPDAVDDDDRPWIERLGPTHPLTRACAQVRCPAAELEFHIEDRTP